MAEESKAEKILREVIFDIACAKCGKIVFSLPYLKSATHKIRCHECGETTIVSIDKNGGISHGTQEDQDTMSERFEEIRKSILEENKDILYYCIDCYDTDSSGTPKVYCQKHINEEEDGAVLYTHYYEIKDNKIIFGATCAGCGKFYQSGERVLFW